MRFILLFLFLGLTCSQHCDQVYDNIECIDDNRFVICSEFDFKTYKYKNQTVVNCPEGTRCVCMKAEECGEKNMCKAEPGPLPLVETGMLWWTKTYFSDCSGCDEATRYIVRGFAYKVSSGRMFKELLTISSTGISKTEILYIPSEDEFIKVSSNNYMSSWLFFENQ